MSVPPLTSLPVYAFDFQHNKSSTKHTVSRLTDPKCGIRRTQGNQNIYRNCSDWPASKQRSPSRESKPTLTKRKASKHKRPRQEKCNATPLCFRYGITCFPQPTSPG